MRVLVTGASGFIGFHLIRFLLARGCLVTKLVRGNKDDRPVGEISWSPEEGLLDATRLEGFDAVIHLAGENIADGRWTEAKKRKILDSRVIGTRLLCQSLARLKQPPKVLISASAIGYYGTRGDAILTEDSANGSGFLAEVCDKWESASQQAVDVGIRVVNPRLGMVLSSNGGALKQMLGPFKYGLGGKIGSGRQYMSWIAIDDVVEALYFILMNETLRGPINIVSPHPVTNAEFTHALGSVLHRPTWLPIPAFAARLVFGELADDLLLSSTRVEPQRLQQAHYQFLYPELTTALHHLLEIPRHPCER